MQTVNCALIVTCTTTTINLNPPLPPKENSIMMVKHPFYKLLRVITRYTLIYLTQSHITIFDLEKVAHDKDEDELQTPGKKSLRTVSAVCPVYNLCH